jgi:flagellar motor switch/type III secretory pathway protein FliN
MTDWTRSFPVALSVEIARIHVTLAELATLDERVLPLHVARDGRVVLRAGERVVARGRLVEVDGALGVQVDALEAAP